MIVVVEGNVVDLRKVYKIGEPTYNFHPHYNSVYDNYGIDGVETGYKRTVSVSGKFEICFLNKKKHVVYISEDYYDEIDKDGITTSFDLYSDDFRLEFENDIPYKNFKLGIENLRKEIVDLWKDNQIDVPQINYKKIDLDE